jgi:hypothetical protein
VEEYNERSDSSKNHILPDAPAGDFKEEGDKATEINLWITTVLDQIACYKAKHRRILKEAASGLQYALPNDIIMNSVLSFLELPHQMSIEEDAEEEGGQIDLNDSGNHLYHSSLKNLEHDEMNVLYKT